MDTIYVYPIRGTHLSSVVHVLIKLIYSISIFYMYSLITTNISPSSTKQTDDTSLVQDMQILWQFYSFY